MRAVIYSHNTPGVPGRIPIAGVPLIVRQVQWLRTIGVQHIHIALGTSDEDDDVLRAIVEAHAYRDYVEFFRTERPIPLDKLHKAELLQPFFAIPADVIGDGDLTSLIDQGGPKSRLITLDAPNILDDALDSATVAFIADDTEPRMRVRGPGWGARIQTYEHARVLGHAALMGELPARDETHRWPIELHGDERVSGVWIERGAIVDPSVDITPPVHIGADAVICRGAAIGPDVCIGRRAVIEHGTRVASSFIAPNTVVAEGIELKDVVAEPDGLRDLSGARLDCELDEATIVSAREASKMRWLLRHAWVAFTVSAKWLIAVILLPITLLTMLGAGVGRLIKWVRTGSTSQKLPTAKLQPTGSPPARIEPLTRKPVASPEPIASEPDSKSMRAAG